MRFKLLKEKIVKIGNKWQVQSEKGRNMGTYDTKAEAKKRLQQVHYFKYAKENLTESNSFPITVYTYQSPEVKKQLENNETYIADYNRANYNGYKKLAKVLGLNNCPIFGALSKKDLLYMLDASNIDYLVKDIMQLEIPSGQLKYTEYYDWTDYMYALGDPKEFEEDSGITVKDLENILRTQKNIDDYDLCQVVFDRIEPEWYKNEEV